MSFKAAIFDMDGLLLDSEQISMACFFEAGRQVGYTLDAAVYYSCIGANGDHTKALLIAGHGSDFPYDDIHAVWRQLYMAETMDKPIPVKAGVRQLLQAIADSGTPIALATSTMHDHALNKLRHAQLADYFEVVIGGDMVTKSKPDPEIYLKAAATLKVAPIDCIAFEDSENGVRAASAAGIHVIQIPDLVVPSTELLALGHTVLGSLNDFQWTNQAS